MWSVPKEWVGERCFILGGGPSLDPAIVPQLKGRIIAVNHAVVDRPDADVLLWADPQWARKYREAVDTHTGKYKISRRLKPPGMPWDMKQLDWMQTFGRDQIRGLSTDPTTIGGYCSGGNALNLAFLFGANPIILLGFDMCVSKIDKTNGETTIVKNYHNRDDKPADDTQYTKKFMRHIIAMAPEIAAHGVAVCNTSMNSRLECFPKIKIERFL